MTTQTTTPSPDRRSRMARFETSGRPSRRDWRRFAIGTILGHARSNGRAIVLVTLAALALGCSDGRSYSQAICVLVDVSGTYAEEKQEVATILKREVLPAMMPGDTLMVIRIDSQSYDEDNLEALMTLDHRPSMANAQKLALSKKLDDFVAGKQVARHTDIAGAMMLGTDYLAELRSGSRVMLVFSDLEQDLPDGTRRKIDAGEFEGIDVVAMNVKRLDRDNADPEAFPIASGELGGGAA